MKLTTRRFQDDYYHHDLDYTPLKPTSRRSRRKGSLKRMAAKARRAEAKAMAKQGIGEP